MVRFDCKGLSANEFALSGQLDAATDFFIRQGYAILDHVLPKETVEALRREFLADYACFLDQQPSGQAQEVGLKRHMISLRFAGGFAMPSVFANPFVLSLVRSLLDSTAILEAYGCILSLPGAPQQHYHYDGPYLFSSALSAMLPPYALTVALPLVEMNEAQGTTVLQPGSHRWVEKREGAPTILPVVPQGSCVLWDYRLRHYGSENRSMVARPMVYGTFSRPWYRDPVNFRTAPQIKRLDLTPSFVAGLPPDVRSLVDHVLEGAPADSGA